MLMICNVILDLRINKLIQSQVSYLKTFYSQASLIQTQKIKTSLPKWVKIRIRRREDDMMILRESPV